ncbi:hypothetical protein [Streptomyces sp. NPDC046727]|uniref:hypothetical protein n=1 Tax=Streptomyces sp. NPDC046727 TaxID=3155373 RepID=UPI0033D5C0AA
MRLNHVPDEPGGGGPDLASSPAQTKAAADTLHDSIEKETKTAGAWADHETGAAVKAFDAKDGYGWLTSGAVSKAHKAWGEQIQGFLHRLSEDEAALRNNNTVMAGTDFGVRAGVRKVSVFDTYSTPPEH